MATYEVAGIFGTNTSEDRKSFYVFMASHNFFLLLLAVVDTWYDLLLKNPQAEQKLRLSVSLL